MASGPHPMLEFRDAAPHEHEIVRPKPRRPGGGGYSPHPGSLGSSGGEAVPRGCVVGSGGQTLHPVSTGSSNGLFLMNSPGQPLPPQVQTNSSSMGCDDGGGGGGGNGGGGGKATPLLRCHTPGKTPPTPIVAASANGSGVAPLKTLPIQLAGNSMCKSLDRLDGCIEEQLVPERDTNTSTSLHVSSNSSKPSLETVNESSRPVHTKNSGEILIATKSASTTVTSSTQVTVSNRTTSVTNSGSSGPYKTGCNANGSNGRSHLHHHVSVEELRLSQRHQRRQTDACSAGGGGSSSDDGTRSSGHASMSDGGHASSSPPVERHQHYRSLLNSVPEHERLSASVMQNLSRAARKAGHNRSRHRATPAKLVPVGSGLEDIKLAIQQLTMHSSGGGGGGGGSGGGYSTSTYSSLSGSEASEPAARRRLVRHSSLETVDTNVTAADEFVWVDSHNRLVELQQLPWTTHDVLRAIQHGRLRDQTDRVSMETVPRLAYLLQRALVRVAREAQRLARPLGLCSKHEIASAFRIVLCPALADSCIKACLRAATMFAVSGDRHTLRQSKAARAGLTLAVGRFHRWMADVRLGRFVHEYAAVYLAAGIENLLEEIVLHCLPTDPDTLLTATMFEHAIAGNGDLWGLLQPFAHLNAGRVASGALAMPRWASQSSVSSAEVQGSTVSSSPAAPPPSSVSTSSTTLLSSSPLLTNTGGGGTPSHKGSTVKSLEQSLLTTCVGSVRELAELASRATPRPLVWTPQALQSLFYFMRCSQLEHADQPGPVQELVYERAYVVLPPLVEWTRVAAAHAEHRHARAVDRDDVMQAARLLLPGVDCPIRPFGVGEAFAYCSGRWAPDEAERGVRRLKTDLAFRLLSDGCPDLIPHALQLLPPAKSLNCVNEFGMTPLMAAAVAGDEVAVRCLLDAGADVDVETPPQGSAAASCASSVHAETQHWTALTYAAVLGHVVVARALLASGAAVEGGARLSEEKCTLTPLQVASASGHLEMVSLLLSHGAHTFLTTLLKDSLSYSGQAQRGCYSGISVAAAHGQRSILRQLLSHPMTSTCREILSLEEILAEGASVVGANGGSTSSSTPQTHDRRPQRIHESNETGRNHNTIETSQALKLNKAQLKSLQEAMYHSAENNHLDITLDLRSLGVPWTLHCWMHTLATAHEHRLDHVIDQLLQDFLQVWPDDCSAQFVDECLPLLFNIFRLSKNEGTTLLLADIFSTCFGWESIKDIRDTVLGGGARIDPKFVNNPELSDVQFRVEGRLFYGHKIVLVTWSPRFRAMLSSKPADGSPPVVHINDIRYHIFQLVMQYLYDGGCEALRVERSDVLELMAAANFFQLDGLLRFCEARAAAMVDLESIVTMYIHAKVYNANELLEYCQGFLLQNMVALLTYDDSVKRLLFGKKLHSHDVLAGLLLTLQARIRSRNLQTPPRSAPTVASGTPSGPSAKC